MIGKDFFRQKILPSLVYYFYKALISTWRIQIVESESLKKELNSDKPVVFAIWHGDELCMISLHKKYQVCTLASLSKDGELMSNVLQRLNIKTARGSSSRGAISGLKSLIRLTREGRSTVFAVDGPRGPLKEIKPGVFEIAKLFNQKIFGAGVAVQKKFVFKKSWNQAYLPMPFTRVVIVWSEEILINKDDDPRDDRLRAKLFHAMETSAGRARQLLADPTSKC